MIRKRQLEYFVAEKPLGAVNGDGAFISTYADQLFVCIMDGAGHGEEANSVTEASLKFIASNLDMTLVGLMNALHENLGGTRGGVAIMGRFDYESLLFHYVGIGNIFLRKIGDISEQKLIQDGVIGYHIRTPQEKCLQMSEGDVLILHSDGLTSHFDIGDYPNIRWDDAKTIANNLITKFETGTDDSICLVLRVNS